MRLYKDLLNNFSLRTIITTLAGISNNLDEIQVSNLFLKEMSTILNMTMGLESLTTSTEDQLLSHDTEGVTLQLYMSIFYLLCPRHEGA